MAKPDADLPDLSPAQREIMEIIWSHAGRELTASEVRTALSSDDRDLARNTVRTLLERMEEKGWLRHRADGRTFYYSAARQRNDSIGQKVRDVVDRFCGGSPETLVSALLDYRGLRPDELKRIRKLLDDAQAHRGGKKGGA